MRISSRWLGFLLNFLLGASWALLMIGAALAFYLYRETGLFSLLSHVLIFLLPGVVMIVLVEYLIRGFAQTEELRRQSRLLERIARELERSSHDR